MQKRPHPPLAEVRPDPSRLRTVPARYYDVLLPPSGSGVRLSPVARRQLARWPPDHQLALYEALAANRVPLVPAGGRYEACRLPNGQILTVSRPTGWVVVQTIEEHWPRSPHAAS